MVRAKPSTKSEVARSSECTEQYAQKVFDNADIVRDAIFRQQSILERLTKPDSQCLCQLGNCQPVSVIFLRRRSRAAVQLN